MNRPQPLSPLDRPLVVGLISVGLTIGFWLVGGPLMIKFLHMSPEFVIACALGNSLTNGVVNAVLQHKENNR